MADKRNSAGNPVWLKWIVLAFIGYAVYLHFTGEQIGPRNANDSGRSTITSSSKTASSAPTISDPNITVGGDIKGSGDTAMCGQSAIVKVTGSLPDGSDYQSDATPEGTFDVKVGKNDKTLPWTQGLTGMQAGGVREILVPVAYLMDADEAKSQGLKESDRIRFRVHLDSLTPSTDTDHITLRVTDTIPARGKLAYCGDTVTFGLVLWNQDGTELFTTGDTPITAQLGDSAVFYGLDRALLGMREGGVRTAIIPPAYVVSPGNEKKHPALEALPDDMLAIADIALIRAESPDKTK